MNVEYPDPVSKLLTYGDCRELLDWPNYLVLGLLPQHVPDLIRLATDMELHQADSEELEVWAPFHAWRALGQLQAEEAIGPLMTLFHELEESEWVTEELPQVYALIGPRAIPDLDRYLADTTRSLWPRVRAATSLEAIGKSWSESRSECAAILTRELEQFEENDPTLNGFLINSLIDLKAVESITVIREAYENGCVDPSINGNLESVEIALGLKAPTSFPPGHRMVDSIPAGRQTPGLSGAPGAKPPKIGRNDPCPCGSGKKYKKCCLNK